MAPFKSPGLEFAGKIVGMFLILPKLQLGVMEHLNSGNRFNGLPWVRMNKETITVRSGTRLAQNS